MKVDILYKYRMIRLLITVLMYRFSISVAFSNCSYNHISAFDDWYCFFKSNIDFNLYIFERLSAI